MGKKVKIEVFLSPEKAENVNQILERLGLNHSQAINIFYSVVEIYRGLPFEIRLPEQEDLEIAPEPPEPDAVKYMDENISKQVDG